MIRQIENIYTSLSNSGAWITFATPVDPNKVVVMLWGEGMNRTTGTYSGQFYAYAWNVPPVWQSMNSSSMQVIPCNDVLFFFNVSVQIVEYI